MQTVGMTDILTIIRHINFIIVVKGKTADKIILHTDGRKDRQINN